MMRIRWPPLSALENQTNAINPRDTAYDLTQHSNSNNTPSQLTQRYAVLPCLLPCLLLLLTVLHLGSDLGNYRRSERGVVTGEEAQLSHAVTHTHTQGCEGLCVWGGTRGRGHV